MFGEFVPEFAEWDFANHIALVAAAIDTWQTTHMPPISSDRLVPGTEYPYFLFGNAGFYSIASTIGLVLRLPASGATAATLFLGFLIGHLGTYLLARSFGANHLFAVVIGLLYASGPYLCLNLLVRADFPEFFAWELVPMLCFLGRRALQASAGVLWLVALIGAMSLPLYLHKLVGPHIILFEAALILAAACRSRAWLARVVALGVSVPCVTVFAWSPLLRMSSQISTLSQGTHGEIAVLNQSLFNYLWPWAIDSAPAELRHPQYGDRFDLQVGLLGSVGVAYGAWCLWKARFRPRNRELYVGVIGGLIYSVLVLGAGGLVTKLPFPLNTIQFSYRLIGLAYASGLIALLAGLSERPPSTGRWRAYLIPSVVALAIAFSVATYWRPPPRVTTIPLATLGPESLVDHSAFYSQTFKSLFNTSGAIEMDGSLNKRPWPIVLAGGVEHSVPGAGDLLPPASRTPWPQTLFFRATVPSSSNWPVMVRIYAVQSSSSAPCANESELSQDRVDTLSALVELCDQRTTSHAGVPVQVFGGTWIPTLLNEQTVTSPGQIDARVDIPGDVYFVAVECKPASQPEDNQAPCLKVDYIGQANQLDNTVKVPRLFPPNALERGAFGQWTIRTANMSPGDYELPTFDYSLVRLSDNSGRRVPVYQFDARSIIRLDGDGMTYSLTYNLAPEMTILAAWACVAIVSSIAIWIYRRRCA